MITVIQILIFSCVLFYLIPCNFIPSGERRLSKGFMQPICLIIFLAEGSLAIVPTVIMAARFISFSSWLISFVKYSSVPKSKSCSLFSDAEKKNEKKM